MKLPPRKRLSINELAAGGGAFPRRIEARAVNAAATVVVIPGMASHLGWIAGVLLLCGGPGTETAAAQQVPQGQTDGRTGKEEPASGRSPGKDEHRPWKFWQGESRTELGITVQQAADIEEIFQATLPKLSAAKERVDKFEAALSLTIQDNTADLATVGQQVDRLEAARAELYKTRTLMLYRMRGVLTADQRAKLQARWEAVRGRGQGAGSRR